MATLSQLEDDARAAGHGVQRNSPWMTVTAPVGKADVNQMMVRLADDDSFSYAHEVAPSGSIVRTFSSMSAVRKALEL